MMTVRQVWDESANCATVTYATHHCSSSHVDRPFTDSDLLEWVQLLQHLWEALRFSTVTELMEYAAQNKLFQNSFSATNYSSEFDRVVVSNGKCTKSVSALLHWKTLGKHAGCIDQLQKVTKHNYEPNIFPPANFVDSHFHLDKLTQRSSIKSLDGIILSCRQYSSNINKYML